VPNLEIGGYILPGCGTGYCSGGGRDDRIYITTDILQAICCALVEHGMVYRVQPIGRPHRDELDGEPNYTTRRALILARAWPPPEMSAFKYADFHAFHSDVVDLQWALMEAA